MGSKVWRAVTAVATVGGSEIVNAASGNKLWGSSSKSSSAEIAADKSTTDGDTAADDGKDSAVGGEAYGDGAMRERRKKKGTLGGEGNSTFNTTSSLGG